MGTLLFNTRTILAQPISRLNWYKKIAAWPFLILLGLPLYFLAFSLTFLPLLMGSAILYSQVQLYLQDGTWYEISVLDAATQSVDLNLSARLREPLLSSCTDAPKVSFHNQRWSRAILPPDNGKDYRKDPKESCRNSSAWISWLVDPASWLGVHKILVPTMSVFSVPVLLFGIGLFTGHFFSQLRKVFAPKANREFQGNREKRAN
jgi:hypothetical protein